LYKYNAYWFLRLVAVTIESELRTIEQRLDKEGDTKEIRRAFWRIVGKIKRLNLTEVPDEIIEKAAHIRNRLFKHNILLGVNRGLGLFFLIALFAFIGFIWALLFFETTLALFIILPPWGRYIGGVIARVKFDGFYRYSPGELGLKIEYTSYLKTTQSRRKWVFGFPVIWIFCLFLLLIPIAMVFNPTGIWTPLLMVLLFGVFYIAIYYRKTGELYRFIRELRIDRELKRK
jgi:hypothetical protein